MKQHPPEITGLMLAITFGLVLVFHFAAVLWMESSNHDRTNRASTYIAFKTADDCRTEDVSGAAPEASSGKTDLLARCPVSKGNAGF